MAKNKNIHNFVWDTLLFPGLHFISTFCDFAVHMLEIITLKFIQEIRNVNIWVVKEYLFPRKLFKESSVSVRDLL